MNEQKFKTIYNIAKKKKLEVFQIDKQFSLYRGQFNYWRNKLGLPIIVKSKFHNRYTKEQIIRALKRYIKEIDYYPSDVDFEKQDYGCGHSTIGNHFGNFQKALDVIGYKGNTLKRYWLDQNYFEKIDSEQKAYFFGLLITDGNIHSTRNVIQIGLVEEDKHILEYLSKLVQTNKPLVFMPIKKKFPNRKNAYSIELVSKKMKKDLYKKKLGSKKTFDVRLPSKSVIPNHLLRHCIRGIFDGDGSIYSKGGIFCITSGSISLLKDIKNYFNKELNLIGTIRDMQSNSNSKDLYFNAGKKFLNTKKIYILLYKGADPKCYLYRKHDIFKKYNKK